MSEDFYLSQDPLGIYQILEGFEIFLHSYYYFLTGDGVLKKTNSSIGTTANLLGRLRVLWHNINDRIWNKEYLMRRFGWCRAVPSLSLKLMDFSRKTSTHNPAPWVKDPGQGKKRRLV